MNIYKIWYHWRGFDRYKTVTAETYEKALKKARLTTTVFSVDINPAILPRDPYLLRDF